VAVAVTVSIHVAVAVIDSFTVLSNSLQQTKEEELKWRADPTQQFLQQRVASRAKKG
jgi:hypothetical protein